MPEPVADPGGLGIEPDIPGEFCIAQFGERLDRDIDPEQMGNPARHGLRKRRRPARAAGEIEPHVELVAAVPVMLGVLLAEHVDLARRVVAPSIDISDNTGVGLDPPMTSSSPSSNDCSCGMMRCGRKNSSAARSTNGSSQPSSALRRIT